MAPKPFSSELYERFWAKVEWGPIPQGKTTPCWIWTAAKDPKGYGRFGRWDDSTRTQLAHRLAWEMIVGPIPSGMTLDHECLVPCCVNPDHLVVVTRGENTLRGSCPAALNRRKTHCPKGHALTGSNLYMTPRGERNCKQCRRAQGRAYRKRHGS